MRNKDTDIEKDEVYNKWFNAFDRKNTQHSYGYGLRFFCEATDMQPSALIKEAREDYVNRVPPWELRHIKRIEDFLTFLKTNNNDLSSNTKLNYVKAVKNFYVYNKIPVVINKTGITQGASERYLDIPQLKIEDIRKAVLTTGTDTFLKAFILTTLSSGQGQNEIRMLKGKHLKDVVNGVAIVNMTRGKTNRRYSFFIGQEALEAIHEHKPNLKDDEFVFTQQKNTNKSLVAQEIDTYFSRHAEKLGYSRSYFAPHRFRHYFKSVLTGNMTNTFIEYLMGHKLDGVESSYFLGNKDNMMKEYLKNQHLLTVFTDKEVLQKQYDDLKQKHDNLTSMFNPDMLNAMIEARVKELMKNG